MSDVLYLIQKTRVVLKRTILDLRFGECMGRKLGDFGVSCYRGSWVLAWRLEMCTNRGQDKLMIPSTIHNETFANMSVSLPLLTLLGLNTACYVRVSFATLVFISQRVSCL
jgi:hypothetical protein